MEKYLYLQKMIIDLPPEVETMEEAMTELANYLLSCDWRKLSVSNVITDADRVQGLREYVNGLRENAGENRTKYDYVVAEDDGFKITEYWEDMK